jgi:1-acyl-sn-glycerol-3-phosphate acyltransferase
VYAFLRFLMRSIVRVYLIGLFGVTGRSRMPRRGALIVCANHPSTVDPALLPAFVPRGDTWSMAKSEWFRPRSAVSWLFTRYHAYPIVRHTPDRRGLRRSRELLDRGAALIIYPEGRRSGGCLVAAEPGAGFLARTGVVPVVPVGLVGTHQVFPKGAIWPRRARMEVRFGAPILIRDRRPDGTRVENQEAADAVMLAIARLLPEEMRGVYAELDGLAARLQGVFEQAEGPIADG